MQRHVCCPHGQLGFAFAGLRGQRSGLANGPRYRFAHLPPPKGTAPGFTLLTPEQTGITFSNRLTDATVARNRLYEIGSGVALGNIDGDGLVDIYFCSLEGANVLYRNLGNWRFEDITAAAGLVCSNQFSTGCVFADVDGDGYLDLLLNSLGGGTRLFLNDGKGHFTEKTDSGLLRRFGATSMALADVDGDGTLDLFVCNYRTDTILDHPPGVNVSVRQAPDGTLSVEPSGRFVVLPGCTGIPQVIERGEPSFLYLNRGAGRFLPVPWHVGLFVDEDGLALREPPTGHEDVFLAQNFFGLDAETSRQDAGVGLVLLGNGQGGFRALGPQEAGIAIYGEQRGSAVADFDGDGRVDLAVAQHGGPTRLFRNVRAAPGVRVRLRGSTDNPQAIGACVRLRWGEKLGPARELHAGSGYWSQDSPTLVLAAPAPPSAVQVRWPGGRQQVWP